MSDIQALTSEPYRRPYRAFGSPSVVPLHLYLALHKRGGGFGEMRGCRFILRLARRGSGVRGFRQDAHGGGDTEDFIERALVRCSPRYAVTFFYAPRLLTPVPVALSSHSGEGSQPAVCGGGTAGRRSANHSARGPVPVRRHYRSASSPLQCWGPR